MLTRQQAVLFVTILVTCDEKTISMCVCMSKHSLEQWSLAGPPSVPVATMPPSPQPPDVNIFPTLTNCFLCNPLQDHMYTTATT